MPQEFFSRTKAMRAFAVGNLCCLISIIISVGLSIELLICGLISLSLPLILFSVLCVTIMVLIDRKIYFMSIDSEPYRISLHSGATDFIISKLNAHEIYSGVFVADTSICGYATHIMIQSILLFDSSELSKQRKKAHQVMKKRCKMKVDVPLYDALKMIRVNLVICERDSPSLYAYLQKNAVNLLHRNETVIPVVVVLSEQIMLYPNCMANLTLNQISRYVAVANYLAEKFSTE